MAAIEELVSRVEHSEELKGRIKKLWDEFEARAKDASDDEIAQARTDYYYGVVELGKAEGLEISVDEVVKFIEAVLVTAAKKDDGELSDDQLAGVAGGVTFSFTPQGLDVGRLLVSGTIDTSTYSLSLSDDVGKSMIL